MEKIKIILPYEGIDENELEEFVNENGASISFDEESNMTAELVVAITTSVISAAQLVVAILSRYGDKLSNQKVTIVKEDGEIIKSGIKIQEVNDFISKEM